MITAAVAAVTPVGPESVVGETPTLKWSNGVLSFPEHTILHNVKLYQTYSHALLTLVQLNLMCLCPCIVAYAKN